MAAAADQPINIVETLKRIRQHRKTARDTRQKFQALANRTEEADQHRKDFYEAVAAIQSSVDSIWAEIRMLYVAVGQTQQRQNILHDAILDLAGDNHKLIADMMRKDNALSDTLNRFLDDEL
jgi:hypothetical protein